MAIRLIIGLVIVNVRGRAADAMAKPIMDVTNLDMVHGVRRIFRVGRRRAGGVGDATDGIRAVACIRFSP
jgi:hypothetical protein